MDIATLIRAFGHTLDRLADPDKDGMPNLLEYALNTNPIISDSNGSRGIDFQIQSGYADLTFHVGQDPAFVNYVLQKSTDLETWETVPFTGDLVPGTDYTQRLNNIETGYEKLFFRLQASEF